MVFCTRTKDRGRYLPEWVAYHWALGVDEFEIFDDESVDDTREVRIFGVMFRLSWHGRVMVWRGVV